MARIKLLLGGDVMLGRGVNEALLSRPDSDFVEVWDGLYPVFEDADYRLVNLECAITRHEAELSDYPKVFYFRADPSLLRCLTAAHIDAVSIANNHILDFGPQGLYDTIHHLNEAGIRFAGAGTSLEQAREITFLGQDDRKIAWIAATDNEPGFSAGPKKPGTHYFPIDLDVATLDWIGRSVERARNQGAALVALSMHWGPNKVAHPSPAFQAFAHAAIDRGIDVFHGHSAHVCQGIEIYRGRPIFYDTGDLLDDYAVDPVYRNDRSCLFRVTFEDGVLTDLRIFPVSLSYARTELARGLEREAIFRQMADLSAEFGTRFRALKREMVWMPESERAA